MILDTLSAVLGSLEASGKSRPDFIASTFRRLEQPWLALAAGEPEAEGRPLPHAALHVNAPAVVAPETGTCAAPEVAYRSAMPPSQLTESVLALPEAERLELARLIVESLPDDPACEQRIAEGVRRLEDLATGKVAGLTADQFRKACEGP
ncbi:MAG: addiction module protein [Verrucomicrobia bacterium]|nr:addiction module protein [Verrucomicrobiota bacterium]